jgi:hypothetical protein
VNPPDAAKPLEQRIAEAERAANESTARALRLEVGLKHNLPPEVADRLRGSTVEELDADAQSLLQMVGDAGSPGSNPTTPARDEAGRFRSQTPVEAHASTLVAMFRRPGANWHLLAGAQDPLAGRVPTTTSPINGGPVGASPFEHPIAPRIREQHTRAEAILDAFAAASPVGRRYSPRTLTGVTPQTTFTR